MDSVKLGMLKLTSGFLNEIRESQMMDVALVNCLSLVNEYKDSRVDENGILKFFRLEFVYLMCWNLRRLFWRRATKAV